MKSASILVLAMMWCIHVSAAPRIILTPNNPRFVGVKLETISEKPKVYRVDVRINTDEVRSEQPPFIRLELKRNVGERFYFDLSSSHMQESANGEAAFLCSFVLASELLNRALLSISLEKPFHSFSPQMYDLQLRNWLQNPTTVTKRPK